MSKTKGGGSTRNGRDSRAQRLGVKVFDGTDYVKLGQGPGMLLDRFLPTRNPTLASAAK